MFPSDRLPPFDGDFREFVPRQLMRLDRQPENTESPQPYTRLPRTPTPYPRHSSRPSRPSRVIIPYLFPDTPKCAPSADRIHSHQAPPSPQNLVFSATPHAHVLLTMDPSPSSQPLKRRKLSHQDDEPTNEPAISNAPPRRRPRPRPEDEQLFAALAQISLPEWVYTGLMLGLIFGGCCSNVRPRFWN